MVNGELGDIHGAAPLGEPAGASTPWADHEWSAEEVRFAAAYLMHRNISRAAREATGCSASMAHRKGAALLARPHIDAYVNHVAGLMRREMLMSAGDVLGQLALLARANVADFVVVGENGKHDIDLSGLTREQMAAIESCEVEVYQDRQGYGDDATVETVKRTRLKLVPKLAALELLGKHHRLFAEVHEVGPASEEQIENMRSRRQIAREKRESMLLPPPGGHPGVDGAAADHRETPPQNFSQNRPRDHS